MHLFSLIYWAHLRGTQRLFWYYSCIVCEGGSECLWGYSELLWGW